MFVPLGSLHRNRTKYTLVIHKWSQGSEVRGLRCLLGCRVGRPLLECVRRGWLIGQDHIPCSPCFMRTCNRALPGVVKHLHNCFHHWLYWGPACFVLQLREEGSFSEKGWQVTWCSVPWYFLSIWPALVFWDSSISWYILIGIGFNKYINIPCLDLTFKKDIVSKLVTPNTERLFPLHAPIYTIVCSLIVAPELRTEDTFKSVVIKSVFQVVCCPFEG